MKKLLLIILTLVLSVVVTAQDLMTIGEVFDFAIDDEYQISGNGDGQSPNADRITITDKYYSADGDTVFYVEYHDSYDSHVENWDSLVYNFWTKTDTVFYTDLDSCITYFSYWIPYDSSMFVYDTINLISEYYCDSLINGFYYEVDTFEPAAYMNRFGKGLGMVENYYDNPAEFTGFDNALFYYKKNGVDCGTPDTLTVSVPENIVKSDIKIFPNPATKYFTIENNSFETLNMKIYNNLGKLLDSQIIYESNTYYDCSLFRSGIYFIWFTTESKKYYKKLIIE